jgi:hypothetical protein
MTLSTSIQELLAYSNSERAKWRHWFATHPAAVETPLLNAG